MTRRAQRLAAGAHARVTGAAGACARSVAVARAVATIGMVVVLATGCGGTGQLLDAGAAPTRQPAPSAAATAVPAPTASASASPAAPTQRPPRDVAPGDPGDGGGDGTGGGGGTPRRTTQVAVYFTRGEQVARVARTVPRVPRIGAAAMEQLLGGPTAAEAADGLATQVPAGTRLRGLHVTDRVAVVDLSGEFETGGGTLGLTLRLAQVACTLDAFPTVDGVRFAVDGEVVDVFSGDGLVVDEPVTCRDYTQVSGGGTGTPPPVAAPT